MKWIVCLLLFVGCTTGPDPDKEYKIARDPSWFPLKLVGREYGVLLFSDELMQNIARQEEMQVKLYPLGWHGMQYELLKGDVDGILTSIPPIPQYRKLFDFSNTYLYTGPVLVVGKDSAATSLDDMAGKRVGVLQPSHGWLVASSIPDVILDEYESIPLALESLSKRTVDGVVVAALPTYAYVRDVYQHKLKVVTPPLTDDGLRLLVAKGENPELLKAFNSGLAKAVKEGTYKELSEKWQLDLGEGPQHPIGQDAAYEVKYPGIVETWASSSE